jgi:hypothetical protein
MAFKGGQSEWHCLLKLLGEANPVKSTTRLTSPAKGVTAFGVERIRTGFCSEKRAKT